jgi:L-histidine Nalpha-methyltransferase
MDAARHAHGAAPVDGAARSDAAAQPNGSCEMCADVRAGLRATQPLLPPKYFYDATGARLFERITELDAYYPTRTELGILEEYMEEIAGRIGARARIVEFGSGSGVKTRALLRSLSAPAAYIPVDIAREQLVHFAGAVTREFPHFPTLPVHADYTGEWRLPDGHAPVARTVAFFPGSTIGNFEPDEALAFLRRVGRMCGPRGGLLVGADLHKDQPTLERAYNDPEGVTAAFNLNLLHRLNRDCGTGFDVAAFRHEAIYDDARMRIEMRLVCERPVTVSLPTHCAEGSARGDADTVEFAAGEYIITEYSHKFTCASFRELARSAGWEVERVWTDDARLFSVWLLERDG